MLTAQQRLAGLSRDLAARTMDVARALDRGDLAAAENGMRFVFAQAPGHPEVLRMVGELLRRRGQHERALGVLLQARDAREDDAMIHHALAGVYEAINDSGHAREALRRACELAPDWAPCWFNYGWRLYVDGAISEALPVVRRALVLAPDDVQSRALLADVLVADGEPESAVREYRKIIATWPERAGVAWWGLATMRPVRLDDDDINAMRAVLQGTVVGAADRVTIGFALAIALENRGDPVSAMDAMQTAHGLAARTEPYDAVAFSRHVDAIIGAFADASSIANPASGREAIFIVGMPRSGSTLVEQILASHSQIAAGAELPDLPETIRQESERMHRPFPEWAGTHTAREWHELGQRYLARTERWRGTHPRCTDKLPGNWIYVGAIMAMLPDARVIVCRRDPLETCFGCYRYMFRRHPYTHDFSDLARRWFDFDRAIRHWKEIYPGRIHEFAFENLVADPEPQIRELLAFCGLPFEEACLNFHANTRRVLTPSASQVREPIRRDTARTGKYGALLDPLRAALGLPAFAASSHG